MRVEKNPMELNTEQKTYLRWRKILGNFGTISDEVKSQKHEKAPVHY